MSKIIPQESCDLYKQCSLCKHYENRDMDSTTDDVLKKHFLDTNNVFAFFNNRMHWIAKRRTKCIVERIMKQCLSIGLDLGRLLAENDVDKRLIRNWMMRGHISRVKILLQYGYLMNWANEDSRYPELCRYSMTDVVHDVVSLFLYEGENITPSKQKDILRGFHLYVDSVPDPFPSELKLKRYCEKIPEYGEVDIQLICCSYVKKFPEMAKSKGPRDLKHLSRCAIRDALCKNCCLPSGIQQLRSVKKLHSYLNLE